MNWVGVKPPSKARGLFGFIMFSLFSVRGLPFVSAQDICVDQIECACNALLFECKFKANRIKAVAS
jgi:hypothetical protein